MEWLVMMGGGLHATSSNLGWNDGHNYRISEDCEENLLEMINNLKTESRVTRPVRRSYAASRIIESDLFPILCASGDPGVYHRVVELLVHLSMPLEITMPYHSKLNPEEQRCRKTLGKMLVDIKKLFARREVIEVVVRQMEYALDECRADEFADKTALAPLEESFKLIRNILHINGNELNLVITNCLMMCGLGDLIIEICEADIQPSIVPNILAVMSLLFKNYSSKDIVSEADRLIKISENNCSSFEERDPQAKEQEQDGGASHNSEKASKVPTETKNAGDAVKRELKSNMAAFALKFVQGSIDGIVKILAKSDLSTHFKDIHFLWLLTFFLPLTKLSEVKYSHIRSFLSPAVICTFSSLTLDTWEKYTKAQNERKDSDSNSFFKCLQLLVTCQHYFFCCLIHFIQNNEELDESEAERLHKTMLSTMNMKSVRYMYVLLLRKYRSGIETNAYLRELISGNHKLLLLAELIGEKLTFDMQGHISQFATARMMVTFANFLSKFSSNTLKQNERAVLMMHHVAIDIGKVELMFQQPILTTIADIWHKNSDKLSEKSYELFDYIIYNMCNECLRRKTPRVLMDLLTTPRASQVKKKIKRLKKEFTLEMLDKEAPNGLHVLPSSYDSEESQEEKSASLEENIATLKELGYSKELKQLQEVLLEVCYLKLDCPKDKMAEPHVWSYTSFGRSVPIVAYTERQQSLQEEELFMAVMDQLGIQRDSSQLSPTIPSFWTADMCLEAASHLGPMDPGTFKFEVDAEGKPICESQLTFIPDRPEDGPGEASKQPRESVNALKYQMSSSSWLMMIQAGNQSKK